jgi:hypothetical protein
MANGFKVISVVVAVLGLTHVTARRIYTTGTLILIENMPTLAVIYSLKLGGGQAYSRSSD